MSELTAERFEQFVELYSQNHTDMVQRLDQMDSRLDKIDTRLGRLETLLWQGEKIAELERRVIRLGELSGDASLAIPFRAPIGMDAPAQS